jgi:hypothetical protein
MESQHAPLGSCPDCTAQIHQRHVLITYETGDGRRRFAECPDCRAVVHPA